MKEFDHPAQVHARSPMRGRMIVLFSLLWVSFATSALAVQPTRLDLVKSLVPGYANNSFVSELPVADFDGDGKPDLISIGIQNYSELLQVIGVQNGTGWKVKQIIVPDDTGYFPYYQPPIVSTWNAQDGVHLLYVRNNLVSTYSGWPLALDHQFRLMDINVQDAIVADVDNNGSVELIVATTYPTRGVRAYSLSTNNLLWVGPELASNETRLRTAQLDADPALEIMISGVPGTIIDGATHAIEWQYKDGFDALMRIGRFGGSTPRFATLGNRMTMFQYGPWSPLWDLDNIAARSASVADINADGVDEIVAHSTAFPIGVRIVDTQTRTANLLVEDYYIAQIAAADFDGDSRAEIVIENSSPSFETQQPYTFRVVDAITGSVEFSLPTYAPGPYVAGEFITTPGNTDFVFGSYSDSSFAGILTRVDSSTGAVRWRSDASGASVDLSLINKVKVANLAGQAHPVVLAAGLRAPFDGLGGKIVAFDADSGVPLWEINSSNSDLPVSNAISGMATVDLNDDSSVDAVLACAGQRLHLFATTDQSPIWTSVAMSGFCQDALVARTGASLQLIAVMSGGLRAYDAQTHLLSWSLPVSTESIGATYLTQGVSGAEFAVFGSNGISIFDAETRSPLRVLSFDPLTPVQAVAQPTGADIHGLVVTINDKLYVMDGETGEMQGISGPMGQNAGHFNQLAVHANGDGSYLIGTGSDVAVFIHRLEFLSDMIFANGFETVTH